MQSEPRCCCVGEEVSGKVSGSRERIGGDSRERKGGREEEEEELNVGRGLGG